MAIDYQKLDNWQKAQKVFNKIIGKTNAKAIAKKKLFKPLDALIKDSDKIAVKIRKLSKKDPYSNDIGVFARSLTKNNEAITKAGKVLVKKLDDNLDDVYDDAIEEVADELDLYKSVYKSFGNMRLRGQEEDLERLRRTLHLSTQFLEPGSFDTTFNKGEAAIKAVAKVLRRFSADAKANDYVTSDEAIIELYKTYNDELPGNSNGMRSVTTFLKAFIDLEMYCEKYKISEKAFKKLNLHPEIQDYATFRKYLKGSAVFIRKLTPWATSAHQIPTSVIETMVNDGNVKAIQDDIGSRLVEAKRTWIKAKTFYGRLF